MECCMSYMDTKNKRKVTGAIVWHENELKVITNQNIKQFN